VAALTGAAGKAVVAWTLASALGAAGVVSFAGAEQGTERTWPVKAVEAVAGLAGLAVLLGVISTASGWYAVPMSSDTNLTSAWAVAGAGAVLLVVTFVLARLR
ncbi:MAG TPA: ABC transporter permease, partial [Cutibacterium acnes]|nr:ABC transporter permease [Cutibacterium acnes]